MDTTTEYLEIEHGLVYASMAGHSLALDLYWHPAASAPEPVVVWIHGGAWMMGDRSMEHGVLALSEERRAELYRSVVDFFQKTLKNACGS
ncbi:MAG: carboxylesterase family protein [Thermoflexales bacterium]|nr:carboxylesterase family protein [Thermoflexales bacterium]